MTSTGFSVSDLSLKETWGLIKTFFILSFGLSILYGIYFAITRWGGWTAPSAVGSFMDSPWVEGVRYTLLVVLALLAAKYLVQILEFVGQFFVDFKEAIRRCSYIGRLGVVLLISGGMYSMLFYPIILLGLVIPILGVIDEYQKLKEIKQ
jgi:hypothetical protein